VHAANLYPICIYVKDEQASLSDPTHTVVGRLLYARTDDALQPDASYLMSGNRTSVRTLDLNRGFAEIRQQLDGIVTANFAVAAS
jgi:5-methylcytosine-specific restriction enzyme subunit McrC